MTSASPVLPQVPNFEHYADALVDFYKDDQVGILDNGVIVGGDVKFSYRCRDGRWRYPREMFARTLSIQYCRKASLCWTFSFRHPARPGPAL
jgi:hypothetical protein